MISLAQILLFIMTFLVFFLARTLGQNLTEKTEKLEAVKKWHKAQLGRQVDSTDIKELGEILEVEG